MGAPLPIRDDTPAAQLRRLARQAQRPGPLPKKFPALIAQIARDHPEAERLEVWFLDEARVGQTGRVCRRWFERGMRPRGVRDLRHQAVYLFGAVCPSRDAGVALVLPTVSAAAMPAVRVWLYLRERFLAHRLWPRYDDVLDACGAAWTALVSDTGRIRSLSTLDWAAPVTS